MDKVIEQVIATTKDKEHILLTNIDFYKPDNERYQYWQDRANADQLLAELEKRGVYTLFCTVLFYGTDYLILER